MRRDRETELAIWARKREGYGSTIKTRKDGASPYALGGEVSGEGLNPSVARCEHCLAPSCPPGYTLCMVVSFPDPFSVIQIFRVHFSARGLFGDA